MVDALMQAAFLCISLHFSGFQDTFLVLTSVLCLSGKMLFRKPERELMTGSSKDLILHFYCWHPETKCYFEKYVRTLSFSSCEQCNPEQ